MTAINTRVLTGITTTGTPHLGNYVGAIRPAIAASRAPNVESFYFLADYHALIKCQEPERIQRSTLEIAATWLACGLDPDKVYFYRQSDIPEIPELTWLLTCVASKGLLNRAHAYKAAVAQNRSAHGDPQLHEDDDAGITMGLFCYPVLMAADILMFNAHRVPVGRDQVQHIEMARDIGQRFNHLFGKGEDFFVLPEAAIEESVATLPGLDGRKMSKSYDNTIPLFAGGAKALRESIMKIVTDSKLPGEPKDPDTSHLFTLFRAFATPEETTAFRADLQNGLAWGEAKQRLFERIERDIAPLRTRYDALIANPKELEARLLAGAAKARALAAPLLARLRAAVGLRPLTMMQSNAQGSPSAGAAESTAPAVIRQYRHTDGKFYFRLEYGTSHFLLSRGFASGKEAGAALRTIRDKGRHVQLAERASDSGSEIFDLMLDDQLLARAEGFETAKERSDNMDALRAALQALKDQEQQSN